MTNSSDGNADKIIMQGVHVELTGAMQTAIREKLSVLLRHNDRIIRINFRLQQDQQLGQNYHYTATAHVEIGGPDLIATVKGEEAYTVIDAVVEKLSEQLRERHERRKDKRNHPQNVELDTELPKLPTS